MKRLAAMQDWPLFWQRAVAATSAARSRSADGITTNGSLPPSSSTVFLISPPAIAATDRPAASLPVSVAAAHPRVAQDPLDRVRADQQGLERALREAGPAEQRPPGSSAVCGTFEACLSSPTLPAISAGAANRITCQSGKFHGITASTGPSGW